MLTCNHERVAMDFLPYFGRGSRIPEESTPMNKVEAWKAEKHGFDVWPDVVGHARAATPMAEIAEADLERMKWYGIFYRKRVEDGRYMVRIRIPGCELTAEQARGVAAMART